MKKYTEPSINVEVVEIEDILTRSSGVDEGDVGGNGTDIG